jgi:hypothetical protein
VSAVKTQVPGSAQGLVRKELALDQGPGGTGVLSGEGEDIEGVLPDPAAEEFKLVELCPRGSWGGVISELGRDFVLSKEDLLPSLHDRRWSHGKAEAGPSPRLLGPYPLGP